MWFKSRAVSGFVLRLLGRQLATNAVLKAKTKIKNVSESGRNRPKHYDFLREMAVRTLPRDPPGEGGPRKQLKIILSTSRQVPSQGSPKNRVFKGFPVFPATRRSPETDLKPHLVAST
jgi:hypothetical protein